MKYPIITFLSDFGLLDEYVPACIGVIKSYAPKVEIVHLTHQIPPGDVLKAAFTLSNSLPFFPENSIHLAIVDPGVGSKRRRLVIKTGYNSLLIGPDNGLFDLVLPFLGGAVSVRKIANDDLFRPVVASTFEGRDVFAPTAAKLAIGFPLDKVGPEINYLKRVELPEVKLLKDGLKIAIIDIDNFGTARFNYSFSSELEFSFTLDENLCWETACQKIEAKFLKTFSQAKLQEPLFFKDSTGFLALAVNCGSAAKKFKLKRFQSGILRKVKKK